MVSGLWFEDYGLGFRVECFEVRCPEDLFEGISRGGELIAHGLEFMICGL